MYATVMHICFVSVWILSLGMVTAQRQPAAFRGEMVVQRPKLFTDSRDHISFLYPASYELNKVAARRFRKWPQSRLLSWLTHKRNGANITAVIVDIPFDLDYIRRGAPTGMGDPYWLLFAEFGPNNFHFYTGGNSAFQHPDAYYYNLNGKILIFSFDGPYSDHSVSPDPIKAGAIEETVLSSLKTPVSQVKRVSPEAIVYRNEQCGFQLTLTPAWRGYRVTENPDTTHGNTFVIFSVPARNAPNGLRLLSLGVQSREVWDERVRVCGCGTNLASGGTPPAHAIARNSTTVFSLEDWVHDGSLGLPEDQANATKYEVDRVVGSFKLLK
jgi:hypothetical protein